MKKARAYKDAVFLRCGLRERDRERVFVSHAVDGKTWRYMSKKDRRLLADRISTQMDRELQRLVQS